MKLMDKKCPKSQEANVERVMDAAFSCDLGWFSTVAMKKKIWMWKLLQETGVMEKVVDKNITKYANENDDLKEVYLKKLAQSEKDVNAGYNINRGPAIQKCLDEFVVILKERKDGEWTTGPVFTRADSTIAIYVQWVKWQIGWDPSLLKLDPLLESFLDEVKDRDSYVKTFADYVEGPIWVGHYWRDRLFPVQRAIFVVGLSIVVGITVLLVLLV
jgi:hypothetical protein